MLWFVACTSNAASDGAEAGQGGDKATTSNGGSDSLQGAGDAGAPTESGASNSGGGAVGQGTVANPSAAGAAGQGSDPGACSAASLTESTDWTNVSSGLPEAVEVIALGSHDLRAVRGYRGSRPVPS